jgi:hypothetical protein
MGFPAVPSNGTSHKRGSCRVPHRTAPNQDLLDAVRFTLVRIGSDRVRFIAVGTRAAVSWKSCRQNFWTDRVKIVERWKIVLEKRLVNQSNMDILLSVTSVQPTFHGILFFLGIRL